MLTDKRVGGTYVLYGNRLARGLFDALVDDSEAAPAWRASARIGDGRDERRRTTAKLLQHLVVLCDALGGHVASSSGKAQLRTR